MIPDFKTYIGESAWGDMMRRGSGEEIRKEDDVNNLDVDGLTDYLKKHYEPLNAYAVITNVANIISVPIIRDHVNHCILFGYETKKVKMINDIPDVVHGLLRVMKNNFTDDQLALFYNNINNLRIIDSNNGLLYKIFLNIN